MDGDMLYSSVLEKFENLEYSPIFPKIDLSGDIGYVYPVSEVKL